MRNLQRENMNQKPFQLLEPKMKTILSMLTAVVALSLTLPAQAQFAKPEDAIKYRKATFTVMSTHFGRL